MSGYAGQCIGVKIKPFSLVWRIGADGALQPASPLIDADVLIRPAAGGRPVRLRGDADLLRLLSDIHAETDWPVVISAAFGPVAAPLLLYLIERGAEVFSQARRARVVSAEEVAGYGKRVRALREEIEELKKPLGESVAAAGS